MGWLREINTQHITHTDMVYVDDTRKIKETMNYPMIMCHMVADTKEELRHMMKTIGIRTGDLIVNRDTPKEYIAICRSQRKAAVYKGAVEITHEQFLKKIAGKVRRAANNDTSSSWHRVNSR